MCKRKKNTFYNVKTNMTCGNDNVFFFFRTVISKSERRNVTRSQVFSNIEISISLTYTEVGLTFDVTAICLRGSIKNVSI